MEEVRHHLVVPCRRCGGTRLDPENAKLGCAQCKGTGSVMPGNPNPAGPGVERLAQHAQAASPVQQKGAAYMFLWDKVRAREDHDLVERIRANYARRDRRQRRTYAKLVRKAMAHGLLVPVPVPKSEDEKKLPSDSGQ